MMKMMKMTSRNKTAIQTTTKTSKTSIKVMQVTIIRKRNRSRTTDQTRKMNQNRTTDQRGLAAATRTKTRATEAVPHQNHSPCLDRNRKISIRNGNNVWRRLHRRRTREVSLGERWHAWSIFCCSHV